MASTGAVGEDVVDLMDQPHPRGSLASQQLGQVPPGMQEGLVQDILGGAAAALGGFALFAWTLRETGLDTVADGFGRRFQIGLSIDF